MSNKSETPANDLLKSQTNVEKNLNKEDSSKQLKVSIPIGGGLHIVGNDERGYCIVMGKARITEWYKTIDELEKETGSWRAEQLEFMVRLISTMIGINEKEIKVAQM